MQRVLLGLIFVTACFSPRVPSNVSCTDGPCPSGQACVAGVCVVDQGGPVDASSSDAPPVTSADRDGDGKANDADNCPDVANTDQINEDGDKFGDACDTCAQIADSSGGDTDGDGLGDVCDPNPGAKDTRWLFNGFHTTTLPADWEHSGNWTAVSDKMRANAPQNANEVSEYLVTAFSIAAAPDNFSVSVTVSVEQMLGTTGDHAIGIEVFDATADRGLNCGIAQQPAGQNPVLFLQDDFNALNQLPAFTWATATEYRLTVTRHAKQYICNVVGPAGATQTTMGNSNVVPRDGKSIDLWAYGMIAQFGSVQITGTP